MHKKLIAVLIGLILLLGGGMAEAGDKMNGDLASKSSHHIAKYQFQDSAENEDAPNIPICKDFMINLKALGEPPMVCDRKFHPKFKQFSWPKWKKLDAWENRDLIFQIWEERFRGAYDKKYPYAKDSLRVLEGSKQYLEQNVNSGDITLAITRVKIDNKQTDVLQFMENRVSNPCTNVWDTSFIPGGRQHYIIDLPNRKIDFKATENSMQFGLYRNSNDHYGDLFLYNGSPYVALWDGNSKSGIMVIKGGHNDYCFIEYYATTAKGESR